MYKQTETTPEITIQNTGGIVNPIATLLNKYGRHCQITNDDHCYVICLEQNDGTYTPTKHIFKEVFEVLKTLPSPN